ncbi:MAG: 2-hydroxyacid dehydrogenase [Azonexus sp.]|nr:2-hydroxyacid dehydrogenase [Azonexus sp.]
MKIAVFSAKRYDREYLDAANAAEGHTLKYYEVPLDLDNVHLAAGYDAVCIFVNDKADAEVLAQLKAGGTGLVALRCTGFNNVDLKAAAQLGLKVVRVTDYSPYSVAEHAVALLQAINRKIHRAYNRTRDSNFALDGLMGFDLHGKSVAVIGTGKIGRIFAKIMVGFGCNVIGYDKFPSPEFEALGGHYAAPGEIGHDADIVSLHAPLTPETYHIINADTIARAKPGVLLINTSRGGLVDTEAVIEGLKSGQIGGFAADVYEQEAGLFFRDLSSVIVTDDVLQRLISFPNVIITGHQAFFTREAITTISETTLRSATQFATGQPLTDEISAGA